jgi:hypothetical protein
MHPRFISARGIAPPAKRSWPSGPAIAGFAVAALGMAAPAIAGESHADASATTQAAACALATRLARLDASHGRMTASHCECLETKEERDAPWSCTAFVTYR